MVNRRLMRSGAMAVFVVVLAFPEVLRSQPVGVDPYLDLRIPRAPIAVPVDGRSVAAYELHVTNYGWDTVTVERIKVYYGDSLDPIQSFARSDLATSISRPGTIDLQGEDRTVIAGGMVGIFYLWIPLPNVAPGAKLVHRVDLARHNSRRGDISAQLRVSTMLQAVEPILIQPPLRGQAWGASGAGGASSHHRRAWFVQGGTISFSQRFAIDFFKIGEEQTERRKEEDPERNENYYAYGEPVLAVADATVQRVVDGIAENVPRSRERPVEITRETIMGNIVILHLGGDLFATYAHLQPGSIRVREGDRVRAGEVLARVGNSGDSMGPHLHFQVSEGIPLEGSSGVPFRFKRVEVVGTCKGGCRLEGVRPRIDEFPSDLTLLRFTQ